MTDKHENGEILSAYLDGELSPPEVERLEERLKTDERLAEELAALRATRELLGSMPRQQAPDNFSKRVLARAERHHLMTARRPDRPVRSFRWISFAAAAVVIAAAGLGTLMLMSVYPPQEDTTETAEAPHIGRELPPGPVTAAKDGESAGTMPTAIETRDKDTTEGTLALKDTAPDGREIRFGKSGVAAKEGVYRSKSASVTERSALGTAAQNVIINTADIQQAQRDVEKVLSRNGIQSTATTTDTRPARHIRARTNVFYQNKPQPSQLQYVVYAEPRQVPKLLEDLNRVSGRQYVVQGMEHKQIAQIVEKAEPDAGGKVDNLPQPQEQAEETADEVQAEKEPGANAEDQVPAETYKNQAAGVEREDSSAKFDKKQTDEMLRANQVATDTEGAAEKPATPRHTAIIPATPTRPGFEQQVKQQETVAGANVQQVLITLNHLPKDASSEGIENTRLEPTTAPRRQLEEHAPTTPAQSAPADK